MMAPDVASQDSSAGETSPAELARVPPPSTLFRHLDADQPQNEEKQKKEPQSSKGSESFSKKKREAERGSAAGASKKEESVKRVGTRKSRAIRRKPRIGKESSSL